MLIASRCSALAKVQAPTHVASSAIAAGRRARRMANLCIWQFAIVKHELSNAVARAPTG
jgi:hypothetical protein